MTKQEILDEIVDLQNRLTELTRNLEEADEKDHVPTPDNFEDVFDHVPTPDNFEDVFDHVWNNISKYFDFQKVQTMMAAVNWEWAGVNGTIQVSDIMEFCNQYIRECLIKKTSIGCGGFEFNYKSPQDAAIEFGDEPEEGKWPVVEVKFVGEQLESYFGDDKEDDDEDDRFGWPDYSYSR